MLLLDSFMVKITSVKSTLLGVYTSLTHKC